MRMASIVPMYFSFKTQVLSRDAVTLLVSRLDRFSGDLFGTVLDVFATHQRYDGEICQSRHQRAIRIFVKRISRFGKML